MRLRRALLGGRIQFTIANGPSVLNHIKAGKLRAIAVTTEKRVPSVPELPTVHEFFPGYIVLTWHGMLAPAGLPKPIASRIHEALGKILTSAEVRKQLESMGTGHAYEPRSVHEAHLRRDRALDEGRKGGEGPAELTDAFRQ